MRTTFVTNPFRSKLSKAMNFKPVLAAVAYVSDVSGLPMGAGDMLICDASDAVARSGGTTRSALRTLVDAGVAVWSLADMHAKVVLCGDRVIVGSANWSLAAENRKIEAGIETDDPTTVAAAKAFVRRLRGRGAVKVDGDFLDRMPDAVPREGSGGAAGQDTKVHHWLMSASELPESADWQEADAEFKKLAVGSGVEFDSDDEAIWLIYRDTNAVAGRVAGGDTVTMIWQPNGEDAVVYPPRRVLRAVTSGDFRGILTLASPAEETRTVLWPVFKQAAIEAGVRKNVATGSYLELRKASFDALAPIWSRRRKPMRKA